MVDTAIAWSHAATASLYLYHIFPVIVPSNEKKTGLRRFSIRIHTRYGNATVGTMMGITSEPL